MAGKNRDWDDLGQSIQDIIENAIDQQDFRSLSKTITQAVDKVVDLGSEAVRGAMGSSARAAAEVRPNTNTNKPVLYGSTGQKRTKGILSAAGGGLLTLVTSISLLEYMLFGWVTGYTSTFSLVLTLVFFAAGVWLLYSGVCTLNLLKRFRTYRTTLGQKTYCTLEQLSRSVGKSVKFVRNEVRQMIRDGLFRQGHLDKEQKHLIVTDETYRQFEQSRLELEERKRLEAAQKEKKAASGISPQVQEVLDKGESFLEQIRSANDAIPGAEISAKISRMELLIQRIFHRAQTNPEVIPDLKKLMDYYLPMSVKLLNAYADMDSQPVQGQTIQKSKQEIEASLDTLNLAYEKLLDSIFIETAIDVSSDITVLNTILAQEGLTEDEFIKMKNQQNL